MLHAGYKSSSPLSARSQESATRARILRGVNLDEYVRRLSFWVDVATVAMP